MAYQKKVWKDLPSEETPLSASGLNNWEDRIFSAFGKALGGQPTIIPNGTEINAEWIKSQNDIYFEINVTHTGTPFGTGILWIIPINSNTKEIVFFGRANAGTWRSGVNSGTTGSLVWKKIAEETNKGYNLTGGTGQTLQQISELPIGWSGLIRINAISTTKDWWGTKLGASSNGLISVWVLSENARGYETRVVGFNPTSVFMDHLLTQVDFIVEQGTTNGTYYEKWNSGKMKMYREFGNLDQGGITWVFPKEFINYPYVNASTSSGSSTQLVIQNINSIAKDRAVIFFMSSFTQRVGANNVVGVAEGRWK